jgi:hypothetical protein
MAVIKITNKELINQIQFKLTLQLGKNFTQQEVVDLCIEYSHDNIEELIVRASNLPKLTPKLADQILKQIDKLPDVPYDSTTEFVSRIDEDIYSF